MRLICSAVVVCFSFISAGLPTKWSTPCSFGPHNRQRFYSGVRGSSLSSPACFLPKSFCLDGKVRGSATGGAFGWKSWRIAKVKKIGDRFLGGPRTPFLWEGRQISALCRRDGELLAGLYFLCIGCTVGIFVFILPAYFEAC